MTGARKVTVRPERPQDGDAIRAINVAAFRGHPFSRQTEHLRPLRDRGSARR